MSSAVDYLFCLCPVGLTKMVVFVVICSKVVTPHAFLKLHGKLGDRSGFYDFKNLLSHLERIVQECVILYAGAFRWKRCKLPNWP